MVKNDRWIKEMALKGMISPFAERPEKKGGISFGLSSYGYDMRLSDEFRIFNPPDGEISMVLDPKNVPEDHFSYHKGENCLIPANSFVLAKSLEYFKLPRDIMTICTGKSTYARSGVAVNVTPLEPEWEGHVTISISNTSCRPVRIYAYEGIAQLIFMGVCEPCEVSYADKSGKYQAQKDITHSKT